MSDLELPFRFPLAVIDFEASALSFESYPIEVGISIAASPTSSPSTWSSLIAPATTWDLTAQWDPDAERLHGIKRWNLRQGLPAGEVMSQLNERLTGIDRVWCDGGHYDAQWLKSLSNAAGLKPQFELHDIGAELRANATAYGRFAEVLRASVAPHRAGPDATRLCAALQVLSRC